MPEVPFPERLPRRRRKHRVAEVSKQVVGLSFKVDSEGNETEPKAVEVPLVDRSATPTPQTSELPSEPTSTQPTTPSAPKQQVSTHARQASRPVVPVVPVVPIVPSSPSAQKRDQAATEKPTETPKSDEQKEPETSTQPTNGNEEPEVKAAPPPRAAPKSWADLVRTKKSTAASNSAVASSGIGGLSTPKNESLADVINSLGSEAELHSNKISFVEPRGLVNTGNMCYMNSVSLFLETCFLDGSSYLADFTSSHLLRSFL